MTQRITEIVNETLAETHPGAVLSEEDVLALIDSGTSPGGSEVQHLMKALHHSQTSLKWSIQGRLVVPQGRHWVLDPIDGTRGFVGQRQYAICLGLIENGQVLNTCPTLQVALQ